MSLIDQIFNLPQSPFTPAVRFLIFGKLFEIALLLGCTALIILVLRVKGDTRAMLKENQETNLHVLGLLTIIREWVELGKIVREDTDRKSAQVQSTLEKKTEEVKEEVRAVPGKLMEKIEEKKMGDSGRLGVPSGGVQLPGQNNHQEG